MTDAAAPVPAQRRLDFLRVLWPYLKRYRGLLFGWLGFLAISSLATLALPVAVRVMIDHGFAHADPASINSSFIMLFGVAIVMALATAARETSLHTSVRPPIDPAEITA